MCKAFIKRLKDIFGIVELPIQEGKEEIPCSR